MAKEAVTRQGDAQYLVGWRCVLRRRNPKTLLVMLLLAGGTMCQISCTEPASATIASSLAELASSVTSQYIRNVVENLLGISTGLPF